MRAAALTLLGLLLAARLCAEQEVIRVLGIGNSFTDNAFTYLKRISTASPTHDFIVGKATTGGCTLQRHVENFRAHEADPSQGLLYKVWSKDPESGETVTHMRSLKSMLKLRQWDVISIQQMSRLSVDADTYRPWAHELCTYIRRYCPTAEIVFHQTWTYRSDADFEQRFGQKGYTQHRMYRELCLAYRELAEELDLRVIPVGAAFQLAREKRPYRGGPARATQYVEPNLPEQKDSLMMGWFWKGPKAGQRELVHDVIHAGPEGRLLAGLVWYEFLTGEDARQLQFSGLKFEAETIHFLQQTAHAVVSEQIRPAIEP